MGCSATKTVPQERSPNKGHSNGDVLKKNKEADAKDHSTGKDTITTHSSLNGRQTGEQTDDETTPQAGDNTDNRISSDKSLSKDIGMRKLQRKETPQAGPLANNNKTISQSQMEFFKLLDEKIEKGGELEEGDEVT